jgi:hypothetical protein
LVWSSKIDFRNNQNKATKQDNTATMQDVNEMQARRCKLGNAIARNRPNPKSEKSQTLFSLA